MQSKLALVTVAVIAATFTLSACNGSNEANAPKTQESTPASTSTAEMPVSPTQTDTSEPSGDDVPGLLTIAKDIPAADRDNKVMSEASKNMATARGTMSTYENVIAQHGSAEIRQKFTPVQKAYDTSMDKANAMMFKIAASDDKTLPDLVAQFNSNWKNVRQALATARQLQLEALSSKPISK